MMPVSVLKRHRVISIASVLGMLIAVRLIVDIEIGMIKEDVQGSY